MTLFFGCIAATVTALGLLFGTGSFSEMLSLHFRFAIGLACFGLTPGVLLYLYSQHFGKTQAADDRFFERALSIVSLSFSFNLLVNIALFLSGSSFRFLTAVVLCFTLSAYLATWWFYRNRSDFFAPLRCSGKRQFGSMAIVVLLFAFLAPLYVQGSPPVNLEELVTLRKLFENPNVYFDNLSFNSGDPTTYLLTPFLVMIVGVSTISAIDITLTYSLFWFVTAFLSFICFLQLIRSILPGPYVIGVALLIFLTLVTFFPNSMIYEAGVLNSYPNRYGFAGGVLIPLNIFIFLAMLREAKPSFRINFLLIYLTIEMTFVHARETLFVLGFFVLTALTLLPAGPRFKKSLVRIGYVVGMTVGILFLYKTVNLHLGKGLGSYVAELQRLSGEALSRMIQETGFLTALFSEGPASLVDKANGAQIDVQIVRFREVFVQSWARTVDYGRSFIPLSMFVLPLFIFSASSLIEIAAASVLVVTALLMGSGVLQLWLSKIIGNPEVWSAYNIVFLFSLLVLVGSIAKFGSFIGVRLSRMSRNRRNACLTLFIGLCAGASLGFQKTFLALSKVSADSLIGIFIAISALSLFLIIAKILRERRRLPLFLEREMLLGTKSQQSFLVPLSTSVLAVAFASALIMSAGNARNLFKLHFNAFGTYPGFTGKLISDYPFLVATGRLSPTIYPLSLLSFLRDKVKPNSNILAPDSLNLATLTPHFFGVVMNDHIVQSGFIVNSRFLNEFPVGSQGRFDWSLLLSSADVGLRLIKTYNLDFLVIADSEKSALSSLPETNALRQALLPVFQEGGFSIYRVRL